MPPKNKSKSQKRQTRLTFTPAPASAVPSGSPVSDKRSPAFVRFARPGQKIDTFFSTNRAETASTRADRLSSPTPARRGKQDAASNGSSGEDDDVGRKGKRPIQIDSDSSDAGNVKTLSKRKRIMRSIDHGSSDDDRSSGHQRETSSSNKRQKRGDDDTSISPRQFSRQATQNAYEAVAEAEKKQQQRQQKLEKAQAAAARTKSAVEKARSEEQFDTLARQQEKLEKKQQKLEKQRLKLEEQQRKLNEERKKLKEISQEEPTFGAKSSTKPPSSPTQIGSRMKMTTISPNQRQRRTRRVFNGTRMLKGYDSPSSDSDDGVGSMKSTKVDTEVVDEHDGNDSEDSDDVITSSQHSRRRQLSKQTSEDVGDEDKKIESNDDDDDDDEIKPHTPRLRRGIVRPSGGKEEAEEGKDDQDDSKKNQNQLDLEDDLEFLEDSAVKDTRTRGTVVNSAKAKRMAYLEQLRQRRSGIKPEEREAMGPLEDEESEGSTNEDKTETRSGQSVGKSRDYDNEREPIEMIDLDQDDEDFIVEGDAEDLVGVPDNEVALPFEFSRHRYKRNKEYFRDVVEWMVHNKLNPAFPRDDAVYKAAFEKVNDEVMGLAASQLISSVWTLDFRRSLEARPIAEFKLFAGESGCDACKRSTHTATYEVAFKGRPYSLRTLEPLTDGEGKSDDEDGDDEEGNDDGSDSSSDDSESSSDEDDEKDKKEEEDSDEDQDDHQDYDRQGNPLPPEGKIFKLGKYCKQKAQAAHSLLHWRYELNEWVVDWLEGNQILTKKEIRRRRKWSVKRQTKYANEVVDLMVEMKEVKRLWDDFKTTVSISKNIKDVEIFRR